MTSQATLIPGKDAVTRTVVETPAIEPKVVVELSTLDAGRVLALLGKTTGMPLMGIYRDLQRLRDAGSIPAVSLKAIESIPSLTFTL